MVTRFRPPANEAFQPAFLKRGPRDVCGPAQARWQAGLRPFSPGNYSQTVGRVPLFPLFPSGKSCQPCRVKEPPPTEKLPASVPGKVKLRSGGIPANLRPVEYHPHPTAAIPSQKSTAIRAGWILLLVGLVLACIPLLGFVSWVIGYPLCFAALILGCLGAANGRPWAGDALILASITAAPLALFVAPFVSTFIAAQASESTAPAPPESKLPPGEWKPRDHVPASD